MQYRLARIMTSALVIGSLSIISGCANFPLTGIPGISAATTQGDDYFPLIEGAKWEFDVFANTEKVGTLTIQHSLLSSKDGVTSCDESTLWSVRDTSGKTTETKLIAKLKKAGDEILRTLDDGTTYTELKLPVKVGSSWKGYSNKSVEVKVSEDITANAVGYRDTFKIVKDNGDGTTDTWWLAKGIGIVKEELKLKDGSKLVNELTKFTKP